MARKAARPRKTKQPPELDPDERRAASAEMHQLLVQIDEEEQQRSIPGLIERLIELLKGCAESMPTDPRAELSYGEQRDREALAIIVDFFEPRSPAAMFKTMHVIAEHIALRHLLAKEDQWR